MSIKYKIIEKANPQNPLAPKKFFACPIKVRQSGFREIAHEIAMRCTVSTPDVSAVLECLIEIIPEKLLLGHTVKLGDFGTFSLSLHCEGKDTKQEVTAYSIIKNKMNFLAGPIIKKALKRAQYKKISETETPRSVQIQEQP